METISESDGIAILEFDDLLITHDMDGTFRYECFEHARVSK